MEKFYGTIMKFKDFGIVIEKFSLSLSLSLSFFNMFKLIPLLAQKIYICTKFLDFFWYHSNFSIDHECLGTGVARLINVFVFMFVRILMYQNGETNTHLESICPLMISNIAWYLGIYFSPCFLFLS